jgi:LysR family glycine cleavage system transcriptional activator
MNQRVSLRPLAIGPLRAFEAVARLLNFRAAGEEMHLTQSAVSRQIQSLEEEIGVPLLTRGTRQVALTVAGASLLRATLPALGQLDAAVQQLRRTSVRPRVSITTFASFASLWLIPRLEGFQRQYPGLDIRINAEDALHDLDDPEIDLALRHCSEAVVPAQAQRLFGECVSPVVSPWLIERSARGDMAPLARPADLLAHTLIESADLHVPSVHERSWACWFERRGLATLQPARWIHFNYDHQQVQAAQSGQGVALGRLALVADLLQRGDLIEPLGTAERDVRSQAYWLIVAPASAQRPEVRQLCDWLLAEAATLRTAMPALA